MGALHPAPISLTWKCVLHAVTRIPLHLFLISFLAFLPHILRKCSSQRAVPFWYHRHIPTVAGIIPRPGDCEPRDEMIPEVA